MTRPAGDRGPDDPAATDPPWPQAQLMLQALPGDPPLTMFWGKAFTQLGPGTDLDRYGASDGTVTSAANPPFEQRSLPPPWANLPYHVYRVRRELQVISGLAVPWFDQPGGGTAYVLPHPVAQLVADGSLAELPRHDATRVGTVKWFDGSEGYGLIAMDGGSGIVIQAARLRTAVPPELAAGDRVEFVIRMAADGTLQADDIRIISAAR